MEGLGWLIVGAVLSVITLIWVVIFAIVNIRSGFSDYTDNELSLKTKRFAVYPLVYLAILVCFWVLMGVVGAFDFFQ